MDEQTPQPPAMTPPPPVQSEPYPEKPPSWPTVFGVIGIILASFGLLGGCCGLFMPLAWPHYIAWLEGMEGIPQEQIDMAKAFDIEPPAMADMPYFGTMFMELMTTKADQEWVADAAAMITNGVIYEDSANDERLTTYREYVRGVADPKGDDKSWDQGFSAIDLVFNMDDGGEHVIKEDKVELTEPVVAEVEKDAVSRAQMAMTLDVMATSLVDWTQSLLAAGLLERGGRVFSMTSAGGRRAWPAYGPVSAAKAALEMGVPTYRFLRRYLERQPAAPLSLKQVDPLIRQLNLYRDLIDRRTTGDPQ